eukprot:6899510-Pyramimonas_sp.AAC.1
MTLGEGGFRPSEGSVEGPRHDVREGYIELRFPLAASSCLPGEPWPRSGGGVGVERGGRLSVATHLPKICPPPRGGSGVAPRRALAPSA